MFDIRQNTGRLIAQLSAFEPAIPRGALGREDGVAGAHSRGYLRNPVTSEYFLYTCKCNCLARSQLATPSN